MVLGGRADGGRAIVGIVAAELFLLAVGAGGFAKQSRGILRRRQTRCCQFTPAVTGAAKCYVCKNVEDAVELQFAVRMDGGSAARARAVWFGCSGGSVRLIGAGSCGCKSVREKV